MLAEEHEVGFAVECGVQRGFISERARYPITSEMQGKPRVRTMSTSGYPEARSYRRPRRGQSLTLAFNDYLLKRSDYQAA